MIARWPGKIEAGTESDFAWAFWDFLPTAAELAQAQPPAGIDGLSVVPALLGADAAGLAQEQHDFLYWEFLNWDLKLMTQATRLGPWKAITPEPGAPLELYNLETDPNETTDVAADHPDIVARAAKVFQTERVEPRRHPVRRWEP